MACKQHSAALSLWISAQTLACSISRGLDLRDIFSCLGKKDINQTRSIQNSAARVLIRTKGVHATPKTPSLARLVLILCIHRSAENSLETRRPPALKVRHCWSSNTVNLQLVEYLKYNDHLGITSQLHCSLGAQGGGSGLGGGEGGSACYYTMSTPNRVKAP